ncbi:MAG TPA: flagellar export chaperone FliS [Ruminococcaceae bacterium]|nr:flagellar export chaperone FliS [Oscillospiraceae bacterium]
MVNNPYLQYKEQSIQTLTQGEILVKMFDQIIKQLNFSKIYIGKKDYQAANDAIKKAEKLILFLKVSLDKQYPIAEELERMYDFLNDHLVNCNITKSISEIDNVIPIISDLREAFYQADIKERIAKSNN